MNARGFVNPEIDPATGSLIDHAGLDILSEEECVKLLRLAVVGRVAFVAEDEVVVFPVNLGWWESGIVFSTQVGSKLHAAVMGRHLTVEVDDFDEATKTGWSVLGRGRAAVVTDGRSIGSLDRLGVRSWVRPDVPKHWVHVKLGSLTGRRTPPPRPAEDAG